MKNILISMCASFLVFVFTVNSYADEATIEWKNGTYNGQLSNGVPDGEGIWIVPEVGWYSGGFRNGKLHGIGMQEYVDGTRYAGEYKDDTRTGQGWFMFGSGELKGWSYIGEWKDNIPWNATEYDDGFNVSATYSEGIKIEI
jgi:hypothetical protein